MHLLRRQVDGYLEEIPQNFVDEWFLLASLLPDATAPADPAGAEASPGLRLALH